MRGWICASKLWRDAATAAREVVMDQGTASERGGEKAPSPIRTHGWRWRGRPLDLYALIVLVLAPGEIAGLFAGTGELALGFQLVRSLPILLIAIIVTLLAVFRPEALAGERPPPRRRVGTKQRIRR
jgi:hypothetical protein